MAIGYKQELYDSEKITIDDKKITEQILEPYKKAYDNTYNLCMYFCKVQVLPGKRHEYTTFSKLESGAVLKVIALMLEYFVDQFGRTKGVDVLPLYSCKKTWAATKMLGECVDSIIKADKRKNAAKKKSGKGSKNSVEDECEEYTNLLEKCNDLERVRAVEIDVSGIDPVTILQDANEKSKRVLTSAEDLHQSSNDEEENEEEIVDWPKPLAILR
ncbi:hypothetical protein ABG067_007836, partial [Albugo candida]